MSCDAPVSIKFNPPKPDGKGGFLYWFGADCGKCLPCLIKRKAQWSYRIVEEQRDSFSSYFVTLTYDDAHLPMGDEGSSGCVEDHKHFMKFLRYYEHNNRMYCRKMVSQEELTRKVNGVDENKKLHYYGCIEYGDKKGRCHSHYILLNVRDINNINLAWCEQVRNAEGEYSPGKPYGKVQIDECNVNTIDYVLKYMVKQKGVLDGEYRQKERSFMSRGLGLGVVNDEFVKHINKPEGNLVINARGGKVPLPRYYNKKFVKDENRNAKCAYVADAIKQKEDKEDKIYSSQSVNADLARANGKDHRNRTLYNRKRREFE